MLATGVCLSSLLMDLPKVTLSKIRYAENLSGGSVCEKNSLGFECFPYVCREPILVK